MSTRGESRRQRSGVKKGGAIVFFLFLCEGQRRVFANEEGDDESLE